MKVKNILIGASLVTIGYQVGKIVTYVKIGNAVINFADEIMPGFKEKFVRKTTDTVIDNMFKQDEKKEEA